MGLAVSVVRPSQLRARPVSSASHVQNSHSLSTEAPVSSGESHWGMCGRKNSVQISSGYVSSLGGWLKGEVCGVSSLAAWAHLY